MLIYIVSMCTNSGFIFISQSAYCSSLSSSLSSTTTARPRMGRALRARAVDSPSSRPLANSSGTRFNSCDISAARSPDARTILPMVCGPNTKNSAMPIIPSSAKPKPNKPPCKDNDDDEDRLLGVLGEFFALFQTTALLPCGCGKITPRLLVALCVVLVILVAPGAKNTGTVGGQKAVTAAMLLLLLVLGLTASNKSAAANENSITRQDTSWRQRPKEMVMISFIQQPQVLSATFPTLSCCACSRVYIYRISYGLRTFTWCVKNRACDGVAVILKMSFDFKFQTHAYDLDDTPTIDDCSRGGFLLPLGCIDHAF
jgi:hypothetical protein